jgi:hypothetical protein
MLFLSKRHTAHGQTSNNENCLSIIGLFLAVGLISGISVLIYGTDEQQPQQELLLAIFSYG